MLRRRADAMRAAAFVAGFLLVALVATPSRADEPAPTTCEAAFDAVDPLLTSGHLVEVRERLRVCAASNCKAWMVKDCSAKLAEVEARMPSLVFAAKDENGNDLVDATVTAGAQTLATRLDGKAVELDPGERELTIARPDGSRVTQKIVVREGEKARVVTLTFEKPSAPPPPAPPPAPYAPPPSSAPQAPPAVVHPSGGGVSMRTVGIVAGAVGVVALGIGAVLGANALASESEAGCDANDVCDVPQKRRDAQSSAHFADAAFGAGIVLTVGGLLLVYFAPNDRKSTAWITPVLSPQAAGAALGGTFR